jgi:cytochrome c6
MMKKFYPFRFFYLVLINLFLPFSAANANSLNSENLFKLNCAVCHAGGNNIIIPEKNLKKETLEENGMNTIQAITYQIINGKNGMPAFGGRLKEEEIEEIAKYILEQAEKNFEN